MVNLYKILFLSFLKGGKLMKFMQNALNTTINYVVNTSQKSSLRGEVAFERWYYHYQPETATKQLGQLSSRVWALASAVESAVKAIIVALSILAYAYMENKPEIEKRREIFKTQGNSLLYSVCAVLIPEVARDAFKEANPPGEIARRILLTASNYTIYRGDIILKMLINTH
ncbi:MAG: hypothetical protein QG627_1236 [Chlamydiota bacterium]|jgi:hypothetical protein|nr:hypothetical protein [Chlamydiota bacterium]